GPQERQARLRGRRGRRCHSSPDPRRHGPIPAPRRVDFRRPAERSAAPCRTRRRSPSGCDPLPQPLPVGARPDRRPELRPEDVHRARLLGPLPEERPVQVQSTPLRQADVPDLLDDLRKALEAARRRSAPLALHGWLPAAERDATYARARALLLPSIWYENAPLVAFEALAWGTPILASETGALPEILHGGMCGRTIRPTADGLLAGIDHFEAED